MGKKEKSSLEEKWALHSYRISSRRPLDDGEVVLGAADLKEFRDPESLVALEAQDLRELGIAKYLTRQEILDCLGKVLAGRSIPELPGFAKKFREDTLSRRKVVSLEEWKRADHSPRVRKWVGATNDPERQELALAIRRAILEVVFFCEIPNESEGPGPSLKPKADSWTTRLWSWISGS